MIAGNNFRDAFLLAKAILTEMPAIIPNCDDSGGYMGGTFQEAIGLFESISDADQAATDLKQQVFGIIGYIRK